MQLCKWPGETKSIDRHGVITLVPTINSQGSERAAGFPNRLVYGVCFTRPVV